jgi:hypothetical protein
MTLAAALEPLRCTNPDCTIAEGGSCARAASLSDPLVQCPDLLRGNSTPGTGPRTADAAPREPGTAPWAGHHMTAREADRMMWSTPARLLAVVGPTDAGKTSMLLSFFLQLADGQYGDFPYRFASSRSLFALQAMCRNFAKWDGVTPGSAVPRTQKADGGEEQRFLHIGLRPRRVDDDRHIDVLFADVAGEHFSAFTQRAEEAVARALTFLDRCDGFIVTLDAGVLASPARRLLDAEMGTMLGRIVDIVGRRPERRAPIAVTLTKIDAVSDALPDTHDELLAWLATRAQRVHGALTRARGRDIAVRVFAVSAIPPIGQPVRVVDPFMFLMAHADARPSWPPHAQEVVDGPAFLAMRRRGEP